jgi:hypothetical protein
MKTHSSNENFDEISFITLLKKDQQLGHQNSKGAPLTYEEARKLKTKRHLFTSLEITSEIMSSIKVIYAPLCVTLCVVLLLQIKRFKHFNPILNMLQL